MNTNSHCELRKGVSCNATNTKAFAGILNEKEQCYSMPYWSLFTRKWRVPHVLLGNTVKPQL